jgi:Transposase
MGRSNTRGHWERLLAKQAGSGLSIAEFCRRNEVSAASFYQWRKKLGRRRPVAEAFVPVAVLGAATLRVEFPCGVVMQLPAGDERSLTKLVTLLMADPETTP